MEDAKVMVHAARAKKEGSCNACSTQIDEHGIKDERVWVIRLDHQHVRLCDRCAAALSDAMKSAFRRG